MILQNHEFFAHFFIGTADDHDIGAFTEAADVEPDDACLVLEVLGPEHLAEHIEYLQVAEGFIDLHL